MTAKDVIMKINKEAEYNALTAEFQGNDTKFVGEYENVRIPTEKKMHLEKYPKQVNQHQKIFHCDKLD